MLRMLRETTGNLPAFDSFDQLVIPYRAVATDIIHLQEVVLDKGFLVDAMMASMSVPGALPPYEIDGLWLVDGGVTNNMPVEVARAMGPILSSRSTSAPTTKAKRTSPISLRLQTSFRTIWFAAARKDRAII